MASSRRSLRTCSRSLTLVVGFSVVLLVPTTAPALAWHSVFSPQVSVPVNLMRESYGLSPTASFGLGVVAPSVAYRAILSYTPLHSVVDSLPGTVHHGSIAADLILPTAFSVRRLSLIGGLGVGVRRLHEGREIEVRTLTETGFIRRTLHRVGFGEPVIDVIGRLGVGFCLWTSPRWSLSLETIYQASYVLKDAPDVVLDLRVDELVQAGLVITFALSPSEHHQ